MGARTVTGTQSPGLAEILNAPGGPSYRQIEYWVDKGYLRPEGAGNEGDRAMWSWPPAEQRVAVAMGRLVADGLRPDVAERIARLQVEGSTTIFDRLVAAGLRPDAAERVARHPTGGPVVLAPGVIISLFPLPDSVVEAVA